MRIVSLLPSATEIVCLLELEDSFVGVSHECDFPSRVRHLPDVVRFGSAAFSQHEIDKRVRAIFNRSGPRLVDGVEILAEILHPEVFARRECPEDSRRVQQIPA